MDSTINILLSWLISTILILVLAFILPGVQVAGFLVALVVAVVIGFINGFVKPFVIFLTLPINILTLGLFTFIIDAFLIMLAAWLVPGFTVSNFWWALLFSIILSIANGLVKRSSKVTVKNYNYSSRKSEDFDR